MPVVPPVASALFNNKEAMDIVLGRRDFCVMAAENSARMRALMTTFKGCHKANIILTFPFGVVPQLGELKLIFDEAWNAGVVDIAVVLATSLGCKVFSYVPFKGDGVCYDTNPILLNSWKRYTIRAENVSKTCFPENKISNLQTCDLLMVYGHKFMFQTYGAVAEYMARAMNASLRMKYVAFANYLSFDGNETCVFLGRSHLTVDLAKFYAFPLHLEFTLVSLAVPRRIISAVQWFRLVDELSPMLWCGIGISFVASVPMFYVLFGGRRDVFQILLFVLQLLLSQSADCRTRKLHFRIYLLSWILFSFIVSSSYLCSLLSKLTVPFSEDAIKNMHDFIESGLEIHVPASIRELLEKDLFENSPYQILMGKFRSVNKAYIDMVDEDRQDIAYVISKEDFEILFESLPYRVLGDEPLMSRAISPMILKKPSPYERVFTTAVLKADAFGAFLQPRRMFDNLEEKALWRRKNALKGTPEPLSLKNLLVVFLIWLIGCGFALLAFVVECGRHYIFFISGSLYPFELRR